MKINAPRRRTHLALLLVAATALPSSACGPAQDVGQDATAASDHLEDRPEGTAGDSLGRRPSRVGDDSIEGRVTVRPWTVGVVEEPSPGAGVATVASLEAESHVTFDRLIVTMEGEALPGWAAEYVDTPVRECGSGQPVETPGDGWLSLRLEGARGHTDAGRATLEPRRSTPGLAHVLQIDRVCDFEGIVGLVVSVTSPVPYRLSVAEGPTRLILDLGGPGRGGGSTSPPAG